MSSLVSRRLAQSLWASGGAGGWSMLRNKSKNVRAPVPSPMGLRSRRTPLAVAATYGGAQHSTKAPSTISGHVRGVSSQIRTPPRSCSAPPTASILARRRADGSVLCVPQFHPRATNPSNRDRPSPPLHILRVRSRKALRTWLGRVSRVGLQAQTAIVKAEPPAALERPATAEPLSDCRSDGPALDATSPAVTARKSPRTIRMIRTRSDVVYASPFLILTVSTLPMSLEFASSIGPCTTCPFPHTRPRR